MKEDIYLKCEESFIGTSGLTSKNYITKGRFYKVARYSEGKALIIDENKSDHWFGEPWLNLENEYKKQDDGRFMPIAKPQKHPHDELIRYWLNNYDTHVVIDKWGEVSNPAWRNGYEYKVIPRKHLDVALAFYNDGAKVECRVDEWDEPWRHVETPMWRGYTEYRIAPKTKKAWIAVDDGGEVITSHVPVSDDGNMNWQEVELKYPGGE